MKDVTYFIELREGKKWVRHTRTNQDWPLAWVSFRYAKAYGEHEFGTVVPWRIVKVTMTFTREVL